MRTRTAKALAVAALAGGAALFSSEGSAHALDPSTKGPLYIQGAVFGYSYGFFGGLGGFGAYRMDVEFGAHFTGRHDGFVLGGRQVFYFGFGGSIGATVARIGYDIPIVIKDGKFELTIAPYGIAGIAYGLCSGGGCYDGAAFNFGFGIDVKFFPMQANGFYVFARPLEASFFVGRGSTVTTLTPAIGVGFAF